MTTLFNYSAVQHIEGAITANREEAARLVDAVLEGDTEAGERINLLNVQYFSLEEAKASLSGTPLAPYRMSSN